MLTTREEAILIINSWADAKTPLSAIFQPGGIAFARITGLVRIADGVLCVSPDTFNLSTRLTIQVNKVTAWEFVEISDSAEYTPTQREHLQEAQGCPGLGLLLPNGELILLLDTNNPVAAQQQY